jgi:hypothetical protein
VPPLYTPQYAVSQGDTLSLRLVTCVVVRVDSGVRNGVVGFPPLAPQAEQRYIKHTSGDPPAGVGRTGVWVTCSLSFGDSASMGNVVPDVADISCERNGLGGAHFGMDRRVGTASLALALQHSP